MGGTVSLGNDTPPSLQQAPDALSSGTNLVLFGLAGLLRQTVTGGDGVFLSATQPTRTRQRDERAQESGRWPRGCLTEDRCPHNRIRPDPAPHPRRDEGSQGQGTTAWHAAQAQPPGRRHTWSACSRQGTTAPPSSPTYSASGALPSTAPNSATEQPPEHESPEPSRRAHPCGTATDQRLDITMRAAARSASGQLDVGLGVHCRCTSLRLCRQCMRRSTAILSRSR